MYRKRKIFLTAAAALAGLLAGCEDSSEDGREPASLAYSVYAGPDAAGSWSTFAFTKDGDGEDVLYYFPDNVACYDAGYVYYGEDGSGSVAEPRAVNQSAKNRPPAAAPGAFTISADEKTITFTSYAGGGRQTFVRRRGRGGDRSDDDPPPSDLTPLAAGQSLDGTVWAATAYRTRDWTTLSVTAGTVSTGTVDVSHSFDCTSFPRNYANYVYGTESTLNYIGPFVVSGTLAGDTWAFLDFYGHGGTITFNRLR
jgi:hypothetical protein